MIRFTHGNEAAASTTVAGIVETATAAEIDTSTSTTHAITPGAFSDSNYGERVMFIQVADKNTTLSQGDSKVIRHVPSCMNGMELITIRGLMDVAPQTDNVIVEVTKNGVSTQMLANLLTIDAGESTSVSAATPATIHGTAGNRAVATDDVLHININQVGAVGNEGDGLGITLEFRIP